MSIQRLLSVVERWTLKLRRVFVEFNEMGRWLLTHLFVTIFQPKKKKNIEHDVFKTKTARIHMQKQDLESLQTRKMKGLKRRKDEKSSATENGETKRSKDTDEWSLCLTERENSGVYCNFYTKNFLSDVIKMEKKI